MNNNQKSNYHNILNERNNNMNNNLNNINNNYFNNDMNNRNRFNDDILYQERLKMLKERQTPQKLDNFQLDRIEKNNQIHLEEEQNKLNNNNNNNMEERRIEDNPRYGYDINDERDNYYDLIRRNNNGMVRNEDKIPNQDYYKQISEYNYINELSKKNAGDLVLPLTKNQILQGVLTDNFNKKHFSK